MAKVINIKWETDGYEIDLPNEVTIPDCFMDSDAGSGCRCYIRLAF